MTTKITLYFDIESPFSLFAYELLLRYCSSLLSRYPGDGYEQHHCNTLSQATLQCRHEKAWNVELILRPVLLGGLFHTTGNSPPGSVPIKGVLLVCRACVNAV